MTKVEPPIQPRCSWCGSVEVSRDAWACFDAEAQIWVWGVVFEDGYCHACDRERSLVDQPIEPE